MLSLLVSMVIYVQIQGLKRTIKYLTVRNTGTE